MEVQDVEAVGDLADALEHEQVVRDGVADLGFRRSAVGVQALSRADVTESPLAKSVTSWPCRTSSSVR